MSGAERRGLRCTLGLLTFRHGRLSCEGTTNFLLIAAHQRSCSSSGCSRFAGLGGKKPTYPKRRSRNGHKRILYPHLLDVSAQPSLRLALDIAWQALFKARNTLATARAALQEAMAETETRRAWDVPDGSDLCTTCVGAEQAVREAQEIVVRTLPGVELEWLESNNRPESSGTNGEGCGSTEAEVREQEEGDRLDEGDEDELLHELLDAEARSSGGRKSSDGTRSGRKTRKAPGKPTKHH